MSGRWATGPWQQRSTGPRLSHSRYQMWYQNVKQSVRDSAMIVMTSLYRVRRRHAVYVWSESESIDDQQLRGVQRQRLRHSTDVARVVEHYGTPGLLLAVVSTHAATPTSSLPRSVVQWTFSGASSTNPGWCGNCNSVIGVLVSSSAAEFKHDSVSSSHERRLKCYLFYNVHY